MLLLKLLLKLLSFSNTVRPQIEFHSPPLCWVWRQKSQRPISQKPKLSALVDTTRCKCENTFFFLF